MASATTIKFGLIAVLIGDGAVSETFAAPCGITQLTVTTNVETQTTNVPDCEDPDLASWLITDEISRSMGISGSGLLAVEALETWREWNLAGGEKNVRVFTDLNGANGGGYYQGPAILTAYEEQGQKGQRWNNSFTLSFSGKPTWVAAA